MTGWLDHPIIDIANAVRSARVTATELVREAIQRITAGNGRVNAITRLTAERALDCAVRVDAMVADGRDPGPLAGVPFGVKDLFDVAGLPTTAGAGSRANAAPASRDAEAILRLEAAGAILLATLNMDEFAYGFATVNAHWGTTRNPRGPDRLAGGSSGGSAAAVAADMLPFALGSDTNGSIRVPASLCGLWGLKPTHGGLPMQGVFPFVDSFDDIGPMTRSAADLALVTAVLAGSSLEASRKSPRVARLGGWFARNVTPPLGQAIARLGEAIGDVPLVTLPDVDKARSAAFLMTAAEGGWRHLPALRGDAMAFDPATRDRLIAGAALPVAAYPDAMAFRETFRSAAERLFAEHDILIAPAVPGIAPLIDNPSVVVDGQKVPARANLGIYTQPISFIGLPVIAAPVGKAEGMPLGVQLIAAPEQEAMLFAFARDMEARGLLGAAAMAVQ